MNEELNYFVTLCLWEHSIHFFTCLDVSQSKIHFFVCKVYFFTNLNGESPLKIVRLRRL